MPVRQALDARELWTYGVIQLDGQAEIGPYRFESDGSLGWLVVRRQGDRDATRLVVEAAPHWRAAWFRCAGCTRRCRRIFDPTSSGCWRCRRCAGLTYLSCRESRRSHRTLGRDPKRQLELAIRMERGGRVRPWEAAAMEWLARRAVARGPVSFLRPGGVGGKN